MDFHPKSESELEEQRRERMKLLVNGEADFVVRAANDVVSQKGVDQIELQVECTDSRGTTKVIKDYLHPAMEHKLRHFCYAVGLGTAYEQGRLNAELCVNRGGRCMVGTDRAKPPYPEKNEIKDYVVASQTKQTAGYQNAKAAQGKAEPTAADIAKRRAWVAYKAKFPTSPAEEIQDGFRNCVAQVFPAKKPELLSAADWDRFVRDDFRRNSESPLEGEPVFAESDIPF